MDNKTFEEQVKAAGSAEEMFEIFSKSKPEAKELSLDAWTRWQAVHLKCLHPWGILSHLRTSSG